MKRIAVRVRANNAILLLCMDSINSVALKRHPKGFKTVMLFKKIKRPFPRPMAHRAVPISVSIALGHASANAVKTTAEGWSTGSSASLTFPLHSHMSSARREGSTIFKFLCMTRPGLEPTIYQLRQTLYH